MITVYRVSWFARAPQVPFQQLPSPVKFQIRQDFTKMTSDERELPRNPMKVVEGHCLMQSISGYLDLSV
jgi:hypothetical protein